MAKKISAANKRWRQHIRQQAKADADGKYIMHATIIAHDNGELEVIWVYKRGNCVSRSNQTWMKRLQNLLS
tara:strand:+ start:6135 stop:6347 length:213 start_codon:yes stop_codon:yes gene_type:complete